jgi:hypothetical protein
VWECLATAVKECSPCHQTVAILPASGVLAAVRALATALALEMEQLVKVREVQQRAPDMAPVQPPMAEL